MRKEDQVRLIEALMEKLDSGVNVDAGCQVRNPVSAYTSPELAQREWQAFFTEHPQVVGLSADLPGPETFLTSTDFGKPIVCTRDAQGTFRAFLNVCRHRGAIVETEARGEKRQFNCPFHAWGYNLGGDLVSVPKEGHFGPVDRSCHGLKALPAQERFGLLWVHPQPDGEMDLDRQLGDLGPELEDWDLDRFVPEGQTTYEHPMNWKLAIDTFGETYHFNTLHRDSLAQDFHGNVQLYDTYERNHRMMLCLRNIDALREMDRADWHVLSAALPVYYIFPNVQLIIGYDGPTLVRVYPDATDPHNSHSQISFYLDPGIDRTELADRQGEAYRDVVARMEDFARIIRDEDYKAAAAAHAGARSGAQEYVTFGRNEPALHHYHNTYRTVLGMPPLQVISN